MRWNVWDAQALINLLSVQNKNQDNLVVKCTNCKGDHASVSKDCPKFKEQLKIQTEKAKTRQEKVQNSLVVRGITFTQNSEKQ